MSLSPIVTSSPTRNSTVEPRSTHPAAGSHGQAPLPQPSVETTRVSISWSSSRESGITSGVDAYRAIEATTEKSANPYARNILSFLEAGVQRAVADGASPEEARDKMQAGLEGFEKGFMQAWNELSAAGILSDDIRAEIAETYYQVRAGMDQLADSLGFERISSPDQLENELNTATSESKSPVSAASAHPGDLSAVIKSVRSSIIEQLEQAREQLRADRDIIKTLESGTDRQTGSVRSPDWMRYDVGRTRDFSFELLTADGDRVTIKASAMQVGTALKLPGQSGVDTAGRQDSSFHFEVDGELDEGELKAINGLLRDVSDLAESFFSGGVQEAFEKAMSLGFDTKEIKGFALNLSMSSVERVTQAYSPEQRNGGSSIWQTLSDFVKPLDHAASMANSLGQNDAWLIEITRIVTEQLYPDHPQSSVLQSLVDRLL